MSRTQPVTLHSVSARASRPQPTVPLPSSNVELDLAIVRDALYGNRLAQEKLCAWHQHLVLAACRRDLARHAIPIDARDLAQEVWVRLLDDACHRLRGFRIERGAFGSFIRMVAWQQASRIVKTWAGRWWKERAAEQRWGRSCTAISSDADPLDHRQFLGRIIDIAKPMLDPIDLALLQELAQGEVSMAELASDMGYNPAMLYKRRQRIRAKLIAAARTSRSK